MEAYITKPSDDGSVYFKKTSQNCRVSPKPGKEEPGRFFGGYFTFSKQLRTVATCNITQAFDFFDNRSYQL
jgi:hypothetical protein